MAFLNHLKEVYAMKYIDYKNMKDFYTIDEVCRLFELEKEELQCYSMKFQVHPIEDQFGNWGFPRKPLCKLHHQIYNEQKGKGWNQPLYNENHKKGPWG